METIETQAINVNRRPTVKLKLQKLQYSTVKILDGRLYLYMYEGRCDASQAVRKQPNFSC